MYFFLLKFESQCFSVFLRSFVFCQLAMLCDTETPSVVFRLMKKKFKKCLSDSFNAQKNGRIFFKL